MSGGLRGGCGVDGVDLGDVPGAGPNKLDPATVFGPGRPPGPPTLIGPCGLAANDGEGGTTTEALTPGGPKTGTVPTLVVPLPTGAGPDT